MHLLQKLLILTCIIAPWLDLHLKAEEFSFVVAADPHQSYYKAPEGAVKEFEISLNQINEHNPDFVVFAGDIISTYNIDEHKRDKAVDSMWDEFAEVVKILKAPYYLLPGNHDINTYSGDAPGSSLKIYKQRCAEFYKCHPEDIRQHIQGKTYFSFDHKECHFILLNAEVAEDGNEVVLLDGTLDKTQLQWLQADLEENKNAKRKFVFLHRPSWIESRHASDKSNKFWHREVHPLLVKHKVDGVFAGHLHRYSYSGNIDGVKYYILSSCGGGYCGSKKPGEPPPELQQKAGRFRHFMRINVGDDTWEAVVVRRDNMYPEDISTFTSQEAQLLVKTKAAAKHTTECGIWKKQKAIPSENAIQAAAAWSNYVYAINNRVISSYDRETGKRISASTGEAHHLNSGFVMGDKMYCAHSNFPLKPDLSEIKVLDLKTMELSTLKDFGESDGSLTWVLRHDNKWWCCFAFYRVENAKTYLAVFDDEWNEVQRWLFPVEVIPMMGSASISGGLWYKNQLLVTGHDNFELYHVKIPESGNRLEFVKTMPAPFAGQGIAYDPATDGVIGIVRKTKEIITAVFEAK